MTKIVFLRPALYAYGEDSTIGDWTYNMTWKTWLLLLFALAAGSAASYAVKSAFFVDKGEQAIDESETSGPKVRLLVANGVLAAGTELNASNVRLVLTPEKDAPRDGVFSFSDFAGRKTMREYKDGEPISLYDVESLEEEEAPAAESGFVPPGYSVVPIEICTASKVNGSRNYLKETKLDEIVCTDDSVDIIVVKENLAGRSDNSLSQRRRSITSSSIVKGASVFAVDEVNRLGSNGPVRASILSVLLDSEQLELVRKASEEGKIKILLNNDELEADGIGEITNLNDGFDLLDSGDSGSTLNGAGQGVEAEAPSLNDGFVISPVESDEPIALDGGSSLLDSKSAQGADVKTPVSHSSAVEERGVGANEDSGESQPSVNDFEPLEDEDALDEADVDAAPQDADPAELVSEEGTNESASSEYDVLNEGTNEETPSETDVLEEQAEDSDTKFSNAFHTGRFDVEVAQVPVEKESGRLVRANINETAEDEDRVGNVKLRSPFVNKGSTPRRLRR